MDPDHNLANPLVVYFAASKSQADDALAIARHLQGSMCLVPLWPEVVAYVKHLNSFNNEIINLSTGLSRKLNKVQAILRGRRLIARLTRRPPFPVFAFGDDLNPIESALIKFVSQRRGKSILVQDGLLDRGDDEVLAGMYGVSKDATRMRAGTDNLGRMGVMVLEWLKLVPPMQHYGMSEVTKIAVYGSASQSLLVDQGVPPEKIRLTGPPRFDELFAASQVPAHPNNGKNILYIGLLLSQLGLGTVEQDRQWLAAVLDLATQRPDWRVILRPRPADDPSLYTRLMPPGSQALVTLDKEKPMSEALAESDLVVMHYYSTILYEAMILNKPVIFLKLKDLILGFKNPDLNNELLIKHVSPPEALTSSAAEILEGTGVSREAVEARKAFLIKELCYTDGGSAARVAQFIEELSADPYVG